MYGIPTRLYVRGHGKGLENRADCRCRSYQSLLRHLLLVVMEDFLDLSEDGEPLFPRLGGVEAGRGRRHRRWRGRGRL